jgi:putative flippase GtrA
VKRLFIEFTSKDFIKFLFVGGFAAIINFSSRIILSNFFTYSVAIFIAYIIGMIVAFLLSRALVFNATKNTASKQVLYFVLVNVVAVLQTLGISILLVNVIFPSLHFNFYNEEGAHIIGISVPIFSSFLGHKYFSFAKSQKNSDDVV